MAKTKPNKPLKQNRHQKSNRDKSKAKLKRLLDAKGISSPVVTKSDRINQLIGTRNGPKKPTRYSKHIKNALSIFRVKAEKNDEQVEKVAISKKKEVPTTKLVTTPAELPKAAVLKTRVDDRTAKNGCAAEKAAGEVSKTKNRIKRTKQNSKDLPNKENSDAKTISEKSAHTNLTYPKKPVKRLSETTVKAQLNRKTILDGITQVLKRKTTGFRETPIEINQLHTKSSQCRNLVGFNVQDIETTIEDPAQSKSLDKYGNDEFKITESDNDSVLSVGSGAEEILSDGRQSFSTISDMDEMILPDVRRKYEEFDESNDWNEIIYDPEQASSDEWEDYSTDGSSNSGESNVFGEEDSFNSDEEYNSDKDSYNSDEFLSQSDDSSNDSCPELVPIYESDNSSQPSSDFSGYSEFSCEHSDCCGHSEGTEETYESSSNESMDTEESINSDDAMDSERSSLSDQWIPVGENNVSDSDSSDDPWIPVDEGRSSEEDDEFSSIASEFLVTDDEERDDESIYFTTERSPMIVSAVKSVWPKIPLQLNHSSLNQTSTMLNTSIDQIVRKVRQSRPVNGFRSETLQELTESESPDEVEESESQNEAEESESPIEVEDPEPAQPDNNQSQDEFPIESRQPVYELHNEFFPKEQSVNQPNNAGSSRPRLFNSLDSRHVLLVLKAEQHFHGILQVTLLAGSATIYGYSLRINEPVTAYSPRGHCCVSIQPVKFKNCDDDAQKSVYLDTVQQILTAMQSDFISHDIYAAIECFDPANDVLLLLEPPQRQLHGVNMIQRYMKQCVFPNVYAFNPRNSYYNSEFILRTKFIMMPRTKLRLPPQWNSLPQEPNSRTLVIGGKGVGKSTFVRYASNGAVQKFGKVLLIDLDIGQPEIFVPQTISATLLTDPILGPGYLQNKTPDRALLFGEINVTVAPLKYYRCVLQLLQFCASRPDWLNVPWIINTMGYNKGFGPELVAAILRAFARITDVVQIQGQRFLDNYAQIMRADVVNGYRFNFFHAELEAWSGRPESVAYRTHVFPSMTRKFGDKSSDWDMSSKDSRFAIVLSNLGALLKDGCEWITDLKPVCASLDSLKVIVSENVSLDQHLRLLNGNLVYLCRQTTEDSDMVECLGIGIVRAVDHATNKVYLLPATTDANLSATTALAVCNSPLPTSLITNHNRRVTGRIPYVYSTDDFIGSKHVVHIGYRPDNQRHAPKK